MNKVVLMVELQDDKIKKKAMKAVSRLSGFESVWVDMKDQKLTLIGDIDPAVVVDKLRELCHTDILSFGLAKEKNKDEKKKAENKNDDQNQNLPDIVEVYEMRQPHYYYSSVEENRKVHDCWCGGGGPGAFQSHLFFLPLILLLIYPYIRNILSKR